MSVRSGILANFETVLKGITGVGDVYTGKYEQVDLDALTLPSLFVLQGSDQEAARSTGYEVFTWRVSWRRGARRRTLKRFSPRSIRPCPPTRREAIRP